MHPEPQWGACVACWDGPSCRSARASSSVLASTSSARVQAAAWPANGFAIDAVFLDREMVVIGMESEVPAWRIVGRRRASAVLELPAGEAVRRGIRPGERLAFTPAQSRTEALR